MRKLLLLAIIFALMCYRPAHAAIGNVWCDQGIGSGCLPAGTTNTNTFSAINTFSLAQEGAIGTPVASATTIALTAPITHITGTVSVATITTPSGMSSTIGGCLVLIADGVFATTTAGNIKAVYTSTANTMYWACYDGSKWFFK